jgi:hypothetical protein
MLSIPKTDSSCTLETTDETPLCSVCGKIVRDCFCDFVTHQILEDTGICIQCGLDNPCNQIFNGEGENGFFRPEFKVYQILVTDSYIVNPGQSVRVKSNIVVMHSLGDPAGFFTITNQHPGY